MNSSQRYNRSTRAALDLFGDDSGEPTFADYALAGRMADAKQTLKALEYQASCIHMRAKRELERIRIPTEQARARVRKLAPAYQEMCARLHIDSEKAS